MNQPPTIRPETSPPSAARDPESAAPWHGLDVAETLRRLDSSSAGLAPDEAARRLERHGPNELPRTKGEPAWRRLLRQFADVLVVVLLGAALVTALLGEWREVGVILAVVLINAVIGFVQEGRAERALASIDALLALDATVLRGGARRTVPAAELVPGDVVLLESGDRVPADLRLIDAHAPRVEEASLTGESLPVGKRVAPVAVDAALGDRRSMAYSSTLVRRGRLTGVVVATGADTEIGRIGAMVGGVRELSTPLLDAVDRFGRQLSLAILLLAGALFAVGLLRGFALHDLFLLAVGFAVAAIPEGLPAIITITLALGVQRMARQRAIVRRLPAVETLGAVTVIGSDKTGTLTRNEMTATLLATTSGDYRVTGTGYAPEGAFTLDGGAVEPLERPTVAALARAALLGSGAEIHRDDAGDPSDAGAWQLEGDPTEGALLVLGLKAGLERARENEEHRRLDDLPFESEQRFAASLRTTPAGARRIFLQGAPERVLAASDFELRDAGAGGSGEGVLDRTRWRERGDRLAAEGYRLIALASKTTDAVRLEPGDLENGFTLLGLVAIIDPPRPEAAAAVARSRRAGIEVKMITGDHALTARAIAAQLGIGDGRTVLTGPELEAMDDEELERAAFASDVFARTSPEHKLRLVRALQRRGEVVAMTGDGVNDAPALKRADVGVAMGRVGSEAAKSAAEVVLGDDDFATIERAVREGRIVYDNLRKAIAFLLPTNGAQALVLLLTVLFAFAAAPITPVQILWVNMVTAVTLALALAFEPAEADLMQRPPRGRDEPLLSRRSGRRVAYVSLLVGGAALLLFFAALRRGAPLELARTLAVNGLVAAELFYLFSARFFTRSSLSAEGLFGNRAVLGAAGVLALLQLAFTYLPGFQRAFGTAALSPVHWLPVLAVGLVVLLAVEGEKALLRRRERRRGGTARPGTNP